MKRNSTYSAKADKVSRKWYLVDATDKVLGRLASKVAQVIRGKDEVVFTPSFDTGDFVIVINASKIKVTGDKLKQKMYFTHSGYPHGAKSVSLEVKMEKSPEKVIIKAVRGMLPKGRLGDKLITKLKVYAGDTFKQQAQKPETLTV